MAYIEKVQARWNATGVGTNSGVTVTQAAGGQGTRHSVGHIACSGDTAALVTIESPASTVLWKKRFAAAFNHSETFDPGLYEAGDNAAVLVKISASTSNCEANIAGYTI